MKLVLGLTGPNAAGKGEVAAYLGRRGFSVHSLSDVVREEALARGHAPEREHLIRVGNLLREAEGPGVLAQRILPRLGHHDVVDSIRNPREVEVLRTLPYFVLVSVTADVCLRFERMQTRGRPGDPTTLEAFRDREAQENTANPNAQRLTATSALADRVLVNDGDLAALHAATDRLLEDLESGPRASSGGPI